MSSPPKVMISAGETSGDRLGAGLARALLARRPELELVGMGGPMMEQAGVRLLQSSHEVAVVGIFEVLRKLPTIRRAMARLERSLAEEKPDLLVPIDFPDFNFALAKRARRKGVPIVYFVSPQVWAWRRGRVATIRHLVDKILVLFPFEVPLYEEAGVPVRFVGHPVVERVRGELDRDRWCARLGFDPGAPIVALLPGSRGGEVARHLPVMLEAARDFRAEVPDAQFLTSRAPGVAEESIREPAERLGIPLVTHEGDFPEVLELCEAGAVASGTASLEAALVGLPMVVVYRMHPLSYAVGKVLVRVEHVALPNLIAGRRIVPELIQGDCNGPRVAEELLRYHRDRERAGQVRRELADVRAKLGEPGVFERAAEEILGSLDRG